MGAAKTFVGQAGCVAETREHVVGDELRVVGDDLRRRQALAEQSQDGGDRDPGTPHAGDPTHDLVIDDHTIHGADSNAGRPGAIDQQWPVVAYLVQGNLIRSLVVDDQPPVIEGE